jgi:polyisoprenoid-binding protein YceI
MATQTGPGNATATQWQIDPAHTLLEFSARHMMFATVKGRFTGLKGTIWLNEANPVESGVEVDIDAASIQTGVEQRDQHLRSPDFLEVEKFPQITFKSTKVEPEGHDKAKVSGDLTIHGVPRPVTLEVEITGRGKNPRGNEVIGFDARTTINRKDFGLGWNVALEAGGVLVGDNLKVELSAEAVRAS